MAGDTYTSRPRLVEGSAPPVTAVPCPHLSATQTTLDTDRDDPAPNGAALLESWEAGIAVTIGLAVLTTLVCTVLGSLALALLSLVAVAALPA